MLPFYSFCGQTNHLQHRILRGYRRAVVSIFEILEDFLSTEEFGPAFGESIEKINPDILA